jgi:hypothetical protein
MHGKQFRIKIGLKVPNAGNILNSWQKRGGNGLLMIFWNH